MKTVRTCLLLVATALAVPALAAAQQQSNDPGGRKGGTGLGPDETKDQVQRDEGGKKGAKAEDGERAESRPATKAKKKKKGSKTRSHAAGSNKAEK